MVILQTSIKAARRLSRVPDKIEPQTLLSLPALVTLTGYPDGVLRRAIKAEKMGQWTTISNVLHVHAHGVVNYLKYYNYPIPESFAFALKSKIVIFDSEFEQPTIGAIKAVETLTKLTEQVDVYVCHSLEKALVLTGLHRPHLVVLSQEADQSQLSLALASIRTAPEVSHARIAVLRSAPHQLPIDAIMLDRPVSARNLLALTGQSPELLDVLGIE